MAERVNLLARQYRWVYQRATNSSEWTTNTADEYHIHHIVPVSWCIRRLGVDPEDYNRPTNLILLTKEEHQVIHPDMRVALEMYQFNQNSIDIVMRRRWKLIEEGKPYWVTSFDNMFDKIAVERTRGMVEPWPRRRLDTIAVNGSMLELQQVEDGVKPFQR